MVSADDSVVACFNIRQHKTQKYVCFRLHEFLKYGWKVGKYFNIVKGFYMGKRGNNMTELGNPLKVLKNLGSGTKKIGMVGKPGTHNFKY